MPITFSELWDDRERLRAQLRESEEWLKACLNMVDGDGMPPNWDGIRAFIKTELRLNANKGEDQ